MGQEPPVLQTSKLGDGGDGVIDDLHDILTAPTHTNCEIPNFIILIIHPDYAKQRNSILEGI